MEGEVEIDEEEFGLKQFSYNNYVERYYTQYYIQLLASNIHLIIDGVKPPQERSLPLVTDGTELEHKDDLVLDQYIFIHSNKVMMVGLSKKHYACQKDTGEISDLNYRIEGHNLLGNHISGKKKHGALAVKEKSIICEFKCDGRIFNVRSVIRGKLVELNSNLLQSPHLLKNDPEKEGFIGIIIPQIFFEPIQIPFYFLTPLQYSSLPDIYTTKVKENLQNENEIQEKLDNKT